MEPPPHGSELRKGRFCESGRIYFITFVTHRRRPIFMNLACARRVICIMHNEPRVESLAFVVMPDHVLWLVGLAEDVELRHIVKSVKGRSGYELNRAIRNRGPFWQPGYHDHAVRKDEDLVGIARYIVANPLRAGLVKRLADYPHWDAVWL
jgi:REP element-mobilizing transposase RayT